MFVAVVTILITLGLTWTQFNLVPPMNNSQIDNSTAKAIQTFSNSVRDGGNKLFQYGIVLLIFGIAFFSWVIVNESSKSKSKFDRSSKIDLDEINEEKDAKLEKPDDKTHGVLDEVGSSQSNGSEKKQLQESLENIRLQVQIEELKLQITKLRNEVETEKLNQIKTKGKIRDAKR